MLPLRVLLFSPSYGWPGLPRCGGWLGFRRVLQREDSSGVSSFALVGFLCLYNFDIFWDLGICENKLNHLQFTAILLHGFSMLQRILRSLGIAVAVPGEDSFAQ